MSKLQEDILGDNYVWMLRKVKCKFLHMIEIRYELFFLKIMHFISIKKFAFYWNEKILSTFFFEMKSTMKNYYDGETFKFGR